MRRKQSNLPTIFAIICMSCVAISAFVWMTLVVNPWSNRRLFVPYDEVDD